MNTRRMTEGNPAKLIFLFRIPLMLGNMFQQLYTIVDTLIVSRAVGVNALAALGVADWYNYLMLSIIQAAAQGFCILLAQDFGARNDTHLKKTLAHAIRLSVILTIILTILAQLSLHPVLALLRTPEAIRPMAALYLGIIFAGIPAQMLFNFTASMLRALGDSKSPLYAMIIASALNVGLDLLFVMVFHYGIAGAAVATILSQLVSGLICLQICRKNNYLKLSHTDFGREEGLNAKLLRLGYPMMLQNIMISVGGMIVEYVVNGLGVSFVAGFTATNKLYGALEMAAVAYGFAMVTYIGQNYGAGQTQRIYKGFWSGLVIALVTGAVIGAFMILLGHHITGAFLAADTPEAVAARAIAYRYLLIIGGTLPILYLLYVTRSTLQGLGDTFMPMISGIAEFIMRTFMALVMTGIIGGIAVMYGEVVAWVGADLVLIYALVRQFARWRKSKTD